MTTENTHWTAACVIEAQSGANQAPTAAPHEYYQQSAYYAQHPGAAGPAARGYGGVPGHHSYAAAAPGAAPGSAGPGVVDPHQQHRAQQQQQHPWSAMRGAASQYPGQQYPQPPHAGAAGSALTQQQQYQHYYASYASTQHSIQQRIDQLKQRGVGVAAARPAAYSPSYSASVEHAKRVAAQHRDSLLDRAAQAGNAAVLAGGAAPSTSLAPPQQHQQHPQGMPPGVKAYAERAFATCAGEAERAAMQMRLHEILAAALANGQLHAIDWSRAPIPALPKPTALAAASSQQHQTSSSSSRPRRFRDDHNGDASAAFGGGRRDEPSYNNNNNSGSAGTAATAYPSKKPRKNGQYASDGGSRSPLRTFDDDDDYDDDDENRGGRASDKKRSASRSRAQQVSREEQRQREARARRFDTPRKAAGPERPSPDTRRDDLKKKRRRQSSRHAGGGSSSSTPGSGLHDASSSSSDKADWTSAEPILGTSEALEKDYFRLTSAPDPATVRPERVLAAALAQLKEKWRDNAVDYEWACNQLKAIRQDLTVQCIKSRLAVNVYETHARVALENADMNEYNQCQTQLKELYAALGDDSAASKHHCEFLAYRVLYYLYLAACAAPGTQSGAATSAELLRIMRDMPATAWADAAVAHALEVRAALNLGNYAAFFALYADAPNMGQYILDMFVDRVRLDATAKIVKAYRPSLPIDAVRRQLGFGEDERAEAVQFLTRIGCVVDEEKGELVTKDTKKIDPAGLYADAKGDQQKGPSSLL
mmetsp:Transcript_3861/g.15319  ORF Transcript_3861/g.15319 Transcript_3861/m.15319 type:complete len:763 (+) Transcript_3861:1659-3947(+)